MIVGYNWVFKIQIIWCLSWLELQQLKHFSFSKIFLGLSFFIFMYEKLQARPTHWKQQLAETQRVIETALKKVLRICRAVSLGEKLNHRITEYVICGKLQGWVLRPPTKQAIFNNFTADFVMYETRTTYFSSEIRKSLTDWCADGDTRTDNASTSFKNHKIICRFDFTVAPYK